MVLQNFMVILVIMNEMFDKFTDAYFCGSIYNHEYHCLYYRNSIHFTITQLYYVSRKNLRVIMVHQPKSIKFLDSRMLK